MPQGFRPKVAPYSHGSPGGVRRVEVAGGPSRFGMDWDRGPQPFRITLLLDPIQYAVWVTFYHTVIAKGTIAFDMDLDCGYGLESVSVNILDGSYNSARTGGNIVVITFAVQAVSTAYDLTDEEVEDALTPYGVYVGDGTVRMPRGFLPTVAPYSHDGPDGAWRDDVPGGHHRRNQCVPRAAGCGLDVSMRGARHLQH